MQDLPTQWIQAFPCKNKTSQETQRNLQKFLEHGRKPTVIYTDNSLEFGKACEDLSWNHCTSTPHRSETNGIAERAVRRAKEGTSAALLQSGLNESWWADSMECYTYLRNVTDLLSDGKTPYDRRFGQPFKGPIIPFGSLVEYYPVSAKDQSRILQFGKKVLPGLFLGYALYAGGEFGRETYWLQTLRSWKRWTHRKSTRKDIHLDTGSPNSRRTSKRSGESEGTPPPSPQDSLPDASEAINDFWSMSGNFICRHHVEPRIKLYSPREESFPIPLKYIDVSRTTHTNLGVNQESRIDDCWSIDQILGQVSHNLLYSTKKLLTDICGPG